MKLTRILSVPFAVAADVISLGNIGGNRSFTQQVFDAERDEQYNRECKEAVLLLAELARALRGEK